MNTAFALAKPFLPKQAADVLDSRNQLKALEIELDYAKRNFNRFELISENIRHFSNLYEMRLCSMDDNQFFLREWRKQLQKLELQANDSVFNSGMDMTVRTLYAKKYRTRLSNFQNAVQSAQLNAIFDLMSIVIQLNTANLLPDPSQIISNIRQEFNQSCSAAQSTKSEPGAFLPKDWAVAGAAAAQTLSKLTGKSKNPPAPQQPSPQEQYSDTPRYFLSPDATKSLNDMIQ